MKVRYVTERSPQGASCIKSRILAVERLLADHALSGVPTRLPWLQRITVSPYPYLIFDEVTESEAIIHAVRHSAGNPSAG